MASVEALQPALGLEALVPAPLPEVEAASPAPASPTAAPASARAPLHRRRRGAQPAGARRRRLQLAGAASATGAQPASRIAAHAPPRHAVTTQPRTRTANGRPWREGGSNDCLVSSRASPSSRLEKLPSLRLSSLRTPLGGPAAAAERCVRALRAACRSRGLRCCAVQSPRVAALLRSCSRSCAAAAPAAARTCCGVRCHHRAPGGCEEKQ